MWYLKLNIRSQKQTLPWVLFGCASRPLVPFRSHQVETQVSRTGSCGRSLKAKSHTKIFGRYYLCNVMKFKQCGYGGLNPQTPTYILEKIFQFMY